MKELIRKWLYELSRVIILVTILFIYSKKQRTEYQLSKLVNEKMSSKDTTSGLSEDVDAWDRNLFLYYKIDHDDLEHYKVVSCGPDGILDTTDDIICERRDLTKWFAWNIKETHESIKECDRILEKYK